MFWVVYASAPYRTLQNMLMPIHSGEHIYIREYISYQAADGLVTPVAKIFRAMVLT